MYAQYEEDDIHYLINNLRNTYERNSWDKRYKLFMHIADFYAMWLSDKKQLWSIEQNIRLFKANLEECEIGLRKKEEDLRSGTKTNDAMGKIRTRKILFVVAAMLLCVLVAVLIRLFFPTVSYG